MATTTYKGAYLPTVSGDSGTWGTLLNTTTFPVLDNNLGGITTKSLTNVNVTLNAAESQSAILRLTGTLSGNVQITTACQGFTFVENATTANYTVTMTNGAGTAVLVPQGTVSTVVADATNGCFIQAGEPAGVMKDYLGTVAPAGYVLASGRTIGSAASGATERASADTYALYVMLWDSYSNSILAVTGGRGASAAADFSANKAIVLPDLRGRSTSGKDNMGGSTAGRLSIIDGTILGTSGGSQTHTLTEAQLAAHTHTNSVGNESATHTHTIPDGTGDWGSAGGSAKYAGAGTITTSAPSASHNHVVTINSAGSGSPHDNMQPTWVVNKIIKL